jgi:hypothetical protein
VHLGARRSSKRRHHVKPKRRKHRASKKHAMVVHRQPAAADYTLANPLSGGELVLLALTGGVGYALADFLGRYMETTAAGTTPAAGTVQIPNNIATAAFPIWQAMASQAGLAAVPLGLSAMVDSPWARAALQGAGLGAGFALFGSLAKSAMASLLAAQPIGQQCYADEIAAQQYVTNAGTGAATTTTTTTTAPGMSGLPRGVGRPALLRSATIGRGVGAAAMAAALAPPAARVSIPANPNAIPVGVPVPAAPAGPANPNPTPQVAPPPGIVTNTGSLVATPVPGTPTPGGPSTGPGCAPCSSTNGGIAATYGTAMQALRDESCLGKFPGMFATFPE